MASEKTLGNRIRCCIYTYNMGCNSAMDFSELRVPAAEEEDSKVDEDDEVKTEKGIHKLGRNRDLVLMAFAETQSPLTPFVTKYGKILAEQYGLDIIEHCNARREHQDKFGGTVWQAITAKVATNINGNLKTMMFGSSKYFKTRPVTFFGVCPEHEHIPNPKKAFAGKLLVCKESKAKILCVGAHFPIGSIGKHMEGNDEVAVMESCKYVMARNLRRVLVRATQAGMFDNDTLLICVGDLNSRTCLPSGVDILTETLKDRRYCAAIMHKLVDGHRGNWIDLSTACGTQHWITYKYKESHSDPVPVHAEKLFEDIDYQWPIRTEKDLYLHVLDEFIALGNTGFVRDKVEQGKPLKRFHFPSAADRVLLFQPRGGAVDQIHIDQLDIVPLSNQHGSDHKPICVNFDLYITPSSGKKPADIMQNATDMELAVETKIETEFTEPAADDIVYDPV